MINKEDVERCVNKGRVSIVRYYSTLKLLTLPPPKLGFVIWNTRCLLNISNLDICTCCVTTGHDTIPLLLKCHRESLTCFVCKTRRPRIHLSRLQFDAD